MKPEDIKLYYKLYLFALMLIDLDQIFKSVNELPFDFINYTNELEKEFNNKDWDKLINKRI